MPLMLPYNPSILKRDSAFLSIACSMAHGRWSSSHETDAHLQSGWADQSIRNLPGRSYLRDVQSNIPLFLNPCVVHNRPRPHVGGNARTNVCACDEACLHVSDSTQKLGIVTNTILIILVPNDHCCRKVRSHGSETSSANVWGPG